MITLKLSKRVADNLHYLLVTEISAILNSEKKLDKMDRDNLKDFTKIKDMLNGKV